ncbi:alpha/beta fold hydrolase [Streptomyces sp. NPDC096132]|uniref:alpha/beta fold hydrolase n=1 Tax=Streptomyces sp. NPDC096132 TaxID=3366075 RepID=UPI00382CB366
MRSLLWRASTRTAGDASRSDAMVDHLVDAYTVVTYDRRGLSRSILDTPGSGATLDEHADDVDRLLAELTDRPARMLGCSMGAVIGLRLAARHPGRLSTLVAHEPAVPGLLPEAERLRTQAELDEMRATFERDGWIAGVRKIGELLGIDPVRQETEPGARLAPLDASREADLDFFVRHDALTMRHADLTPAELDSSAACCERPFDTARGARRIPAIRTPDAPALTHFLFRPKALPTLPPPHSGGTNKGLGQSWVDWPGKSPSSAAQEPE